MSTRTSTSRRLIALCSAFALAGCAGNGSDQEGSAARVVVSGRGLSAPIAQVTVTVSQGDGAAFPSIVASLSQVGTDWSGFITGIPAGPGRQFDVVALDAAGATLAKGTAKAEVKAGGVAMVAIVLSQATTGNPYQNNAPVIDYVSASETLVKPGASVRLGASAHDPDPTDTVGYAWVATCGTIANPAAATVEWIAPAAPGSCQVSVSVTDNRGASVAAYLVIEVGSTTGDVVVTVTGGTNVAPVITGMAAQVTYGDLTTGNLLVNAMDPDGDAMTFVWSSDCTGLTFKTTAPNSPVSPSFASTDTGKACVLTVTVTDAMGSHTVGVVKIAPRPVFNLAPVITSTVQPTVDLTDPLKAEPVNPGDVVLLGVQARDPEGQNLTFTWTASAGTLNGQVDQVMSPGKSVAVFHVPATVPAGLQVTVKVSDLLGESNSHVFFFKAAGAAGNPCTGKPDGTACSTGSLCTTGQTCTAGACGGGQAKVCTASDACHAAGTCDAATGTCSNPPVADGTTCNDGNLCTTPDVCAAGVCVGAAKCATGQTCDPAVGVCSGGTNPCAGVVCTASDQCHEVGVCNPATGVCSNPVSTNGKACNDGLACTRTDTCQAGACVGGNPLVCTAPATCVEPGGTCQSAGPATPVAQIAVQEGGALGQAPGFGYDAQGTVYQGGNMFQPGYDFGTGVVTSAGSSDVFVAKLDPATGRATASTWARSYGDAANDQTLQALAVSSGQVGLIGNFSGLLDFGGGASLTNSGNLIDYVAALDPTTGTGIWIKGVNLNDPAGPTARLLSIASTPGQARFAVCGYVANKVATPMVNDPAAMAGGGFDIVVSVLDGATGNLVWGKQFGGTGDQTCNAVTFDDAGDVILTGTHKGVLTFPPLAALPNPTGSNSWAFVAKLNGQTSAGRRRGRSRSTEPGTWR
jgi:hypothetical protein